MAATKKTPVKKTTPKPTAAKKPVKSVPSETKTAVTKAHKPESKTKTEVSLHQTLSLPVVDIHGKEKSTIAAPKALFGALVNDQLVAQAVRVYLANQREGSAATKTRGNVAGSTRKIYRQKGTGRARHGGIRAPIFVGGGITFGPLPRDHSRQLPDKMRRLALASSLTQKVADKSFFIVDGLEKLEPKTKHMAQVVHTLTTKQSVLLVTDGQSDTVVKTARNIAGVTVLPAASLHTYAVVSHAVVICMKQAIQPLTETFVKN